MPRGPVRRGQLISPFGPGAMMILPDGVSVICGGLDNWFKYEDGTKDNIDPREYQVDEWRLAGRLNVARFYLPPDYRRGGRHDSPTNRSLTVPFLRFPQWHYCTRCGLMRRVPLVTKGRIKCAECEARGWTRYIVQVPFVAMCDAGHIQDFPWVEWVYETSAPPQNHPPIRLISTGGMTLAGQKVKVDGGPERTLAGITNASPDGNETDLSRLLDSNQVPHLCPGHRPWLGTESSVGCGRPLRGTLRSAANVYFSQIHTSIYLPRSEDTTVAEVISLLEQPPISTFVGILRSAGVVPTPANLRAQFHELVQGYTDLQLEQAINTVCGGLEQQPLQPTAGDDAETGFRRQEYDTLTAAADFDQLVLRPANLQQYAPEFSRFFHNVTLVHKLRETRALTGFTRVFADTNRDLASQQAMLRINPPTEMWLPAYVVFGEGIFLSLNEEELREWEGLTEVEDRVEPLLARYAAMRQARHLRNRDIGARYVLLHTLAHLLINRLTYECGYSSAALRERIYVSENREAPMAGVLIYTAAGDAEGTLGGLVRMGKPGRLEPLLQRALAGAQWCSADPVCMEMGQSGGQGPDSLNLAACHGCCLVPETACEEFNRMLDRGLVVGPIENPSIGFFSREPRSAR
ncbi:MAG: DUF1998 domain-containing protein [Planctomyces sp.]|nr:DUF1998 domain-containing protein [Planctomyces sp.]